MGIKEHPLYKTWRNMISRCTNKNHPRYKDWGGRGIKVCDNWRTSFQQFLKDMGPKTTKEHSLDRINNNGDYEPINCKWSTRQEQYCNRRFKESKVGFRGIRKQGNKYYARIHFKSEEIKLGGFTNIEQAIEARKKGEIKYWGRVMSPCYLSK